jgi:uncharacterized damage-inducible protein DinB
MYRKGGVGAMMDEYERAAGELTRVVESLSDDDYSRIVDPHTTDEDCRSAQTMMSHVVGAGYGYANYLRRALAMPGVRYERRPLSRAESLAHLETMLAYTIETLDGRWEMTDEDMQATLVRTRWGSNYDMEQMLEHAIVHILRHRRQIERLLRLAQKVENRK